jgi:hypothetical protein
MLGRLFGKKRDGEAEARAEEAFGEAKEQALVRVLGPMDDMVLHAIIPFAIGGGLDLYTFSQCIPGVVFATQELIGSDKKSRPKKNRLGAYELVACLPPGKARDDEEGVRLINRILNPIARYAFHASLNPGETAEIPGEEGGPNRGILFDDFNPRGVPFEVNGEGFGLLLVMPLHGSELAYARTEGSGKLLVKLKAAGAWPYADEGRGAVV